MTNQEAIEILEHLKGVNPQSLHKPSEQIEAYDIAINALKNQVQWNDCNEVPQTPGFKVGDWIVRGSGFIYEPSLIKEIRDYYICESQDGERATYTLNDVHKNFHLWTIADARDGDVLVCYSEVKGNSIEQAGIFNRYVGRHGGCSNTFLAHTGIDWDGNIIINGYMGSTNILPATKEQRDMLFAKMKEVGYQWDAENKELRKNIKPMFKVGDWVVSNKDSRTRGRITSVVHGKKYPSFCGYHHTGGYFTSDYEDNYHLWTIADAEDGEVLCTYECGEPKIVFILRGNPEGNCSVLSYYCYYNIMYPHFETEAEIGCLAPKREDVKPATKEQRDLLFQKMEEAGYEWDAEKKELRKIKPHYDISNFKPFDKVLVRDGDMEYWNADLFSSYYDEFHCFRGSWEQCIPYNDDTKHLIGTNDPCDERYVNW